MLVISNAMCKSASTVVWWYTKQLIYSRYGETGRQALREEIACGTIDGVGEFLNNPLTKETLSRLIELSQTAGPIVAKAHCPLTDELRSATDVGEAIATFCYRDPRDMILSARDHFLRKGTPAFAPFTSVTQSIATAKSWCVMACEWIESQNALTFEYQQIVADPSAVIRKLAGNLELEISQTEIREILDLECKRKVIGWNEFNSAKLTRYGSEMTQDEIRMCNEQLGPWISRMGFDIEPMISAADGVDAA